jgi:hypothetical protein
MRYELIREKSGKIAFNVQFEDMEEATRALLALEKMDDSPNGLTQLEVDIMALYNRNQTLVGMVKFYRNETKTNEGLKESKTIVEEMIIKFQRLGLVKK